MGCHSSNRVCPSVLRLSRVQQALRELVDRFAGYSLRLNTRLAYESRQRTFRSICARMRIDSAAPLTELQLCGVCIVYAHQHRITSLAGFVSAIAHYAMRMGFPDLPRGRTFDRVKAGLLNWFGDTNFSEPARGFTLDDLRAIRSQLDLTVFADARDWCAALFAFFGLLRVREYTCSGATRTCTQCCAACYGGESPHGKQSLVDGGPPAAQTSDWGLAASSCAQCLQSR
jgi:hypothetical protein